MIIKFLFAVCVLSGVALLWASASFYLRIRHEMFESDAMLRKALQEIEEQQMVSSGRD
ncbi:MAG TPA: hypothetical protein VEG30_00535 [Terriglobales bacterium]|nr:hypothetical protein [Terriglobales bacterium]